MSLVTESAARAAGKKVTRLESVVVRFAGDSGDGMQLAGTQFSDTSALVGNDISTFPDYPAEIRAPAGTLAGVSGFQIHIAAGEAFTPGDQVDLLVAMNPAALKANLRWVKNGGLVLANKTAFTPLELKKAGYEVSPLDDDSLKGYRLIPVAIDQMNMEATKDAGLGVKDAERCKNMFALGLVYWLYDRPLDLTLQYIAEEVRQEAGGGAGQYAGAQGRLPLRRDGRDLSRAVSDSQGQAAARGDIAR